MEARSHGPRARETRNDAEPIAINSPKELWLVGEVVELPGCYSQAPNLPELERNIQEAIQAYLRTAVSDEPLPDFVGTRRIEVSA